MWDVLEDFQFTEVTTESDIWLIWMEDQLVPPMTYVNWKSSSTSHILSASCVPPYVNARIPCYTWPSGRHRTLLHTTWYLIRFDRRKTRGRFPHLYPNEARRTPFLSFPLANAWNRWISGGNTVVVEGCVGEDDDEDDSLLWRSKFHWALIWRHQAPSNHRGIQNRRNRYLTLSPRTNPIWSLRCQGLRWSRCILVSPLWKFANWTVVEFVIFEASFKIHFLFTY